MEVEKTYASKGVAGTGLGLGIAGTALGLLNGGWGNILGGRSVTGSPAVDGAAVGALAAALAGKTGTCNEDHTVNRYELALQQKIAEKDSQIALRDSNTYNDQKQLETYKYVDGRLRDLEARFGEQAVRNQATKDSIQLINERLECAKNELNGEIRREAQKRKCADNAIVTYLNATFYPKMVADVTTGTTTTAQPTYNPLPLDDCDCAC